MTLTPNAESASNEPMAGPRESEQAYRRVLRTSRVRYGEPAGADERTRQPRGDLRRQQIIDAAVELVASKGSRGTGVAALAERVGTTATGLLCDGAPVLLRHERAAALGGGCRAGPDGCDRSRSRLPARR